MLVRGTWLRNSITISDSTLRWPHTDGSTRAVARHLHGASLVAVLLPATLASYARCLREPQALYASSQRMLGLMRHYPPHRNLSLG